MQLTKDNQILFALKNYQCATSSTITDFHEDFRIFTDINKLLTRYRNSGTVSIHLILNNIVISYNLFGNAATELLLLKTKPDNSALVKTFALFLGRISDTDSRYINITIDEKLLKELKWNI